MIHIIEDITHEVCTTCGATREQIEDGISCGKIRCRECTLLRICYGDICDECRRNIESAIRSADFSNKLPVDAALTEKQLEETLKALCELPEFRANELRIERYSLERVIAEHLESHGMCDISAHRYIYREYYIRDPWFEVWFKIADQNIALFVHDPANTEKRAIMSENLLCIRNEEGGLRARRIIASPQLHRALWRVMNED